MKSLVFVKFFFRPAFQALLLILLTMEVAQGAAGKIKLQSLPGTNSTVIQSPDTLAADRTFVLPATLGSKGNGLSTDGSGNLSFVRAGGNANLTCELSIGEPAATLPLTAYDDSPALCGNKYGVPLTITSVQCYSNAGSSSIRPIITGGSVSSILSAALTCGIGSFTTGTLNGAPVQKINESIDINLNAVNTNTKHMIIRINRELP
jgi:hypothetical protein